MQVLEIPPPHRRVSRTNRTSRKREQEREGDRKGKNNKNNNNNSKIRIREEKDNSAQRTFRPSHVRSLPDKKQLAKRHETLPNKVTVVVPPDNKKKPTVQKERPISKLNLQRRRNRWYVVIRHACDEKDHTDYKYQHDPSLCNNPKHGRDDIIALVKKLCEKCGGEPEQIYTSPLVRCLLTAKRMKKALRDKPELVIDPAVSRYFSPSEQEHPDVSAKSLKRGMPITESRKEFEKRIEKHLNKMEKSRVRVIWCVTHALVMKRVDLLNQEKQPFDHIDPLEYKIFQR